MIIKSLLDTDLYKLTMQQFAFHFMPEYPKEAVYALKCRSGEDLTIIKKELEKELKFFQNLSFTSSELSYLKSLKIFKKDYLDFLKTINLNTCSIDIISNNNKLEVRVSGPWSLSILFEVPILAMIQELYFNKKYNTKNKKNNLFIDGNNILSEKINLINNSNIKFAEFGTRRRLSFDRQYNVSSRLLKECPENLVGTSNVLIAKKLKITPIGTMAHEFFSAMQGLDFIPLELSQKYALHQWHKEYKGELGIALTDIFNMDVFLHDLDFDLISKYSGFRHDSGDPITWGERIINHLSGYGVNSKDKTLVFSDRLNIPKAIKIKNHFESKTNVMFGIGTNLTNDFSSHKAMSLVMKMVSLNNNPVIKVSDEPNKINCESEDMKSYTLKFINATKKKENTYPTINNTCDIILYNKTKVLLIKRGDKNEAEYDKYALPGGFIDYSEKSKDAILREVEEELGLKLKRKKLNFYKTADKVDRDPRRRTISQVYSYKISDKEMAKITANPNEVKSIKFIKNKKITEGNMAFDHYDILKSFFKN